MNATLFSRRRVLGGLLAVPVISVTGCGSDNNSQLSVANDLVAASGTPQAASEITSGQVKTVFTYFNYSAEKLETVQDDLPTVPTNVTTTADRFAQGALCYEFAGSGSSVMIKDDIQGFSTGDFALYMWVKSAAASSAPMQLLEMVNLNNGDFIITVDEPNALLTVSVNGVSVAAFQPAIGAASIADGAWHHLALQRAGASLQFFLDGLPRGTATWTQPLPANPLVVLGNGWQGAIDQVRMYNRAFPAQGIPQSVYQWTQVKASTAPATENLLAYFPFLGNTANYLGYGPEGVANNAVLTTDRYGAANAAYLFNGVDACVTVNADFQSMPGDFALGFWEESVNLGQMTGLGVSRGGVEGAALDFVFNAGAAVQVYLNGNPIAALAFGSSGELTDGKWHFILLQHVGGTLQLYVDANLVASVSDSSIFFGSTSVMQVGCGSGASDAVSYYWNGKLDDVQIYGMSLTQEQVAALLHMEILGRDGVGALSFQGKMWLLGGWNPNFQPDTNSEVWSSTDGINWTFVTRAPWQRRHDAGYAVFDNKMWIVGGDKETGSYQNDVWCSPDGLNWQQVTNDVPWANRATQYVLAFSDRLWLMGGQHIFESGVPPGPVVAFNDVYSSVDGINWDQVTPAAPWSPRGMIMGNVVYQGRMWVIGGGQYDIRTFNNDVWNSPDGINWTRVLGSAPWSARQFQNITVFDNKIWVLAGGDAASQGGTNEVWYSTDGALWTQLEGTPWTQRHAASAVGYNDYLYLAFGSFSFPNDDVWKMGYAP
jgi:hypothetical protein